MQNKYNCPIDHIDGEISNIKDSCYQMRNEESLDCIIQDTLYIEQELSHIEKKDRDLRNELENQYNKINNMSNNMFELYETIRNLREQILLYEEREDVIIEHYKKH